MKLRDWDWEKQAFVETDYPDSLVAEFMEWLRNTKAWQEDVEMVHRRLNRLNIAFAEFRQQLREQGTVTTVTEVDKVAGTITTDTAPRRKKAKQPVAEEA